MESTLTVVGIFQEGSSPTLMLKLVGENTQAIMQADVDSISYDIWRVRENGKALGEVIVEPDTTTPPAPITINEALDPNDVIFDTLQANDPRWTQDEAGYNFRATIPANMFPAIPLSEYPNPHYFNVPIKFTFNSAPPLTFDYYLKMEFNLKGKG